MNRNMKSSSQCSVLFYWGLFLCSGFFVSEKIQQDYNRHRREKQRSSAVASTQNLNMLGALFYLEKGWAMALWQRSWRTQSWGWWLGSSSSAGTRRYQAKAELSKQTKGNTVSHNAQGSHGFPCNRTLRAIKVYIGSKMIGQSYWRKFCQGLSNAKTQQHQITGS